SLRWESGLGLSSWASIIHRQIARFQNCYDTPPTPYSSLFSLLSSLYSTANTASPPPHTQTLLFHTT
ncbi:hypothetical protein A2U01_0029806, partial [Trifolium medium]|nr:hypothetical protein [Trifolium medium]